MVSEIVQKDLNIIVKEIMKEEGIAKYTIQIEGQTSPGDNFLADVIFFKITADEPHKEFKLVMKTAKRSEEVRKLDAITYVYSRELFVYSVIFPTFQRFIEEQNCNFIIDFLPKLYWKEAELLRETLILENLSVLGYKLWDRKVPWNLEHSLLAMEKYGKFHALSFALKSKKPEVFQDISKDLWNVGAEFANIPNSDAFFKESWNNMIDTLKTAGKTEWLEKLEEISNDIVGIMTATAPEEDRLVICHGDCWSNNFMFKYKNENDDNLSKMCFLDFQLVLLDSPARDLCHNIYVTCDKTCLDHFDLLIETYYRSLSDSVKVLGGNIKNIFSFEDLGNHLKKYSKYGLVISTLVLKIAVAAKNEVPGLETGMKASDEMQNYQISNEDEYRRRLFDIASHYVGRFL